MKAYQAASSSIHGKIRTILIALVLILAFGTTAKASNEDLAKQLANPVAALISVPFQLNYDENHGPEEK